MLPIGHEVIEKTEPVLTKVAQNSLDTLAPTFAEMGESMASSIVKGIKDGLKNEIKKKQKMKKMISNHLLLYI